MDITIQHMDKLFAVNAKEPALNNMNPAGEMHKRQVGLADEGDILQAALIDVYPYMGQQNRMEVLNFLSMRGDPKQNVQTIADKFTTLDTRIMNAINHSLPSIIQDSRHKAWHAHLVKTTMNRLVNSGIKGKYSNETAALPKAISMLYGGYQVFPTNAPFNIAFSKQKLRDANVGLNEWEEVQDHLFIQMHQKYGGKISFVPRANVLEGLDREELKKRKKDIELSPWTPYSKKNEGRFDMQALGVNKYNAQWNEVYKRIVKNQGSSIQFGFINSGNDPTKIQGVIVEHMSTGEKRIIGDMLGLQYDSSLPNFGSYVPANFSMDNVITMMQSRQAWQKANSGDDVIPHSLDIPAVGGVWDGLDVFTAFGRIFNKDFGEEGGDFSREVILNQLKYTKGHWEKENGRKYRDWPIGKRGPDGNYGDWNPQNGKGYAGLATNTFGGKYFTEIFAPGQVENDLFFQPLGEELLEEEKRLGRKMTEREVYDLYQIVKGRLNGKPDFWSGMLDNRVTDMLFQGKGWYDPDDDDSTPRTLFDAYVMKDGKRFFGSGPYNYSWVDSDTPIADWLGRGIKHFAGEDAKFYYDMWRVFTMPFTPVGGSRGTNTNIFR